jgi:hypothetical protein
MGQQCNENEAFVTGGDKRGQFSVQEELRENCFKTLKFAVLKARAVVGVTTMLPSLPLYPDSFILHQLCWEISRQAVHYVIQL